MLAIASVSCNERRMPQYVGNPEPIWSLDEGDYIGAVMLSGEYRNVNGVVTSNSDYCGVIHVASEVYGWDTIIINESKLDMIIGYISAADMKKKKELK